VDNYRLRWITELHLWTAWGLPKRYPTTGPKPLVHLLLPEYKFRSHTTDKRQAEGNLGYGRGSGN
jgi:hypothetical protein